VLRKEENLNKTRPDGIRAKNASEEGGKVWISWSDPRCVEGRGLNKPKRKTGPKVTGMKKKTKKRTGSCGTSVTRIRQGE